MKVRGLAESKTIISNQLWEHRVGTLRETVPIVRQTQHLRLWAGVVRAPGATATEAELVSALLSQVAHRFLGSHPAAHRWAVPAGTRPTRYFKDRALALST